MVSWQHCVPQATRERENLYPLSHGQREVDLAANSLIPKNCNTHMHGCCVQVVDELKCLMFWSHKVHAGMKVTPGFIFDPGSAAVSPSSWINLLVQDKNTLLKGVSQWDFTYRVFPLYFREVKAQANEDNFWMKPQWKMCCRNTRRWHLAWGNKVVWSKASQVYVSFTLQIYSYCAVANVDVAMVKSFSLLCYCWQIVLSWVMEMITGYTGNLLKKRNKNT